MIVCAVCKVFSIVISYFIRSLINFIICLTRKWDLNICIFLRPGDPFDDRKQSSPTWLENFFLLHVWVDNVGSICSTLNSEFALPSILSCAILSKLFFRSIATFCRLMPPIALLAYDSSVFLV